MLEILIDQYGRLAYEKAIVMNEKLSSTYSRAQYGRRQAIGRCILTYSTKPIPRLQGLGLIEAVLQIKSHYPHFAFTSISPHCLAKRVGIRIGSKVTLVRNRKPHTGLPLAPLIDDIISPPLDRQTTLGNLQAEKDNQSSKRDPSGKGGSDDIIVLGPKSHISLSDELETEPGDHYVRPIVAEVIRTSPISRPCTYHDGM